MKRRFCIEFDLFAAGWPTVASYVNGTSTFWTYDDAGRVSKIEHKNGATNLLTLDYHYTADGLIYQIDESDATNGSFAMNYGYDKRGRLISESRVQGSTAIYDFAYEYDQVGNRTVKTDNVAGTVTTYTYDVSDTTYYEYTHNNRLLKTETLQGEDVIERVWYAYKLGGHVKRIARTTDPTADPVPYTLYCFDYNTDQQVWLARGYEVEVGETTTCETGLFAREFRYDAGGRRRYWSRERDPSTLAPLSEFGGWREFLGESIYADLDAEVDAQDNSVVNTVASRRYLHAADGQLIGWQNAGGSWQIVHADHLGSTRVVTGASGTVGSRIGYSAFGEIMSNSNPGGAAARSRYGYCGGWGYENDALADAGDLFGAAGLLHVGARYYSPSLGRFVQRDPISVAGGMNVYGYALANPLRLVDPSGRNNTPELMSTAQVANTLNAMSTLAEAAGTNVTLIVEGAEYTYLGPGVLPGEMSLLTNEGLTVSRFLADGLYNVMCNMSNFTVGIAGKVIF